MLLAAALALGSSVGLARAPDCLASDAVRRGQWLEAEQTLRSRLEHPLCAAEPLVVYNLAFVVHKQVPSAPTRACEARALYEMALERLPASKTAAREAARQKRDALTARCACQPPVDEMRTGRWIMAESLIDRRLADADCAEMAPALRLARARTLDHLAGESPARACDAEAAWEAVAGEAAGALVREADAGARRMRIICRFTAAEACARPGDEDGNGRADCDDPVCAGTPTCAPPTRAPSAVTSEPIEPAVQTRPSATPTVLAIGAGVAAAAGIGLYVGAWQASERTVEHGERMRAAETQDAQDIARADFLETRELIRPLFIGSMVSGAIAVGLGIGAALTWGDTVEVTPTAVPGGAGVRIRY